MPVIHENGIALNIDRNAYYVRNKSSILVLSLRAVHANFESNESNESIFAIFDQPSCFE